MAAFARLFREKWTTVPDPQLALDGQTILITGTNAGIGFETAKKLAALRPKRLIITTRSISKGEQTLKQIQAHLQGTGSTHETEIIPLVLDMSTLEGVETFMQTLRQTVDRLDGAILNAGATSPTYHISADGYEDTLQINTISTIYLAVLILPMLLSTAKATSTPTHLTIVSSRTAVRANAEFLSPFLSSDEPLMKQMSEETNFPPGFMGGQRRYGESKLLLEYAMRNLVEIPVLKNQNGKPYVIINSVCPGVTVSELGRKYPWGLQLFVKWVFYPLFAKSSEQGAVCYLKTYAMGDESYGKLSAAGDAYIETWEALSSEDGQKLSHKTWDELVQIMRSRKESSVTEILGSST